MLRALIATLFVAVPALAQVQQGAPNVPEFSPAFKNQTRAPALVPAYALQGETVASGLKNPWAIAVLPGEQGYLVTERAGTLRHISKSGTISAPIDGLPPIRAQGQGGLLDVKLGPGFASDRLIYWTYSKPVGNRSITAAARGRLSEDLTTIEGATDIFQQTPATRGTGHYGSRIVLTDSHAFITTGDRQGPPMEAQNPTNTIGTIARVLHDGRVTRDNPFVAQSGARPEIWTIGHRNMQGAMLHPTTGDLWTIEHGPAGGDELNRIEKGKNYGWPVISYGENYNGRPVEGGITQKAGLQQPVYYWDPVIAPGDMITYTGAAFPKWQGDILIASLRPGGIVRLKLNGARVVGEERLAYDLGRVRDIAQDTDGSLLVATDRSSGQIIRLTPQ